MDIQWYPGHMMKAKRQMQEDMKLIDLIIELVDARVPRASRNPDIDQLGKQKSRLILLNKSDMADERQNQMWLEYFKKQGFYALLADSRNKTTLRSIQPLVAEACKEKLERDARRGIKNRPIRAMVAGIPNVGKSTFINLTQAVPARKPATGRGLRRENSGFAWARDWSFWTRRESCGRNSMIRKWESGWR